MAKDKKVKNEVVVEAPAEMSEARVEPAVEAKQEAKPALVIDKDVELQAQLAAFNAMLCSNGHDANQKSIKRALQSGTAFAQCYAEYQAAKK